MPHGATPRRTGRGPTTTTPPRWISSRRATSSSSHATATPDQSSTDRNARVAITRARSRTGASLVVAGMHVEARDALAAQHVDVAPIVFDAEAEVEAEGTQVTDRGLLELSRHVVVAPRPHDQKIPTDLVVTQPRLGEVVHPFGPGSQQDDPQVRVQEIEQHLDLFDDVVIAAGFEEPLPIAARSLEVVLAIGRVGEDTIDVDDRGRSRVDGSIAPVPMVGGWDAERRHPSSVSPLDRYCSLMAATTAGSARVVVSPSASSSATLRSRRRMILPARVLGRSSVNKRVLGLAIGPITSPTWSRSANASASSGS